VDKGEPDAIRDDEPGVLERVRRCLDALIEVRAAHAHSNESGRERLSSVDQIDDFGMAKMEGEEPRSTGP
jgi:hypothetical protein